MEKVLEAVQQEESGFKNRRAALLMGGAALAGLAVSRNAKAQTTTTPPPPNDILNFALNLEYLEAQFFSYATTGAGFQGTTSGVGTTGSVKIKANPMVPFTTPGLQQFAMELAQDESNHVKFLQGALNPTGGTAAAVAMPDIDLMTSFQALAMAAGIPNPSTFDPFESEDNFLIGAFIFEDVGVTAYQGAAPYLMSGQNGIDDGGALLGYALGIHGVEAYHAGSIRQRIFYRGSAVQMLSQQVAAARATLDGTSSGVVDDYGVGVTTYNGISISTLVDTNIAAAPNGNSARTYARTPSQVLNIVYGNAGATPTPGAFFPNGMNGNIK